MQPINLARPQQSLTGRRFGRLTCILPIDKNVHGGWRWLCECDCSPGTFRSVDSRSLLSGRSRSCGCGQREAAAKQALVMGRANRTHGGSGTPEHKIWDSMIQRCDNPNAANYQRYGGRGITVCARWRSFPHFIADMGPRPSPDLSIDRIDNDGNYEPGNCRWTTRSVQALNRVQNPRDTITGRYIPRGE